MSKKKSIDQLPAQEPDTFWRPLIPPKVLAISICVGILVLAPLAVQKLYNFYVWAGLSEVTAGMAATVIGVPLLVGFLAMIGLWCRES